MLPVGLILLYMVYLGMGPGACKFSRPLNAGFILFQFWVGLISVVPVLTVLAVVGAVSHPFHHAAGA